MVVDAPADSLVTLPVSISTLAVTPATVKLVLLRVDPVIRIGSPGTKPSLSQLIDPAVVTLVPAQVRSLATATCGTMIIDAMLLSPRSVSPRIRVPLAAISIAGSPPSALYRSSPQLPFQKAPIWSI